MVNLVQAWAENYKEVRPTVSVQVAGGGSGVGIAGLIDGTLDIAAASREMKGDERQRASRAKRRRAQGIHGRTGCPRRVRPQGQPARCPLARRARRDLRRTADGS